MKQIQIDMEQKPSPQRIATMSHNKHRVTGRLRWKHLRRQTHFTPMGYPRTTPGPGPASP
ncbi:hypothetical protein GCM10011408_13160 [Dyella caseinilytica]|nr:hypothetical protein GCM10011408_13160 [Dyella caseinilytica]